MRLFIALPLPRELKFTLYAYQQALREVSPKGRYVPFENFHITLHFIGESTSLLEASSACNKAVAGIRPFTLKLLGFNSFRSGEGQTGYIKIGGELSELRALHEVLLSSLLDYGFSLGSHKKFTPHITLGRGLNLEDEKGQHIDFNSPGKTEFKANSLVLYESRHENNSLTYAPLHTARF